MARRGGIAATTAALIGLGLASVWMAAPPRAAGASLTTYGGAVRLVRRTVCLGQRLEASVATTSPAPVLWSLDDAQGHIVYPLLDAQGTSIDMRLPKTLAPGTYTLAADVKGVFGNIVDYLSAEPVSVCGSGQLAQLLAKDQIITPFVLYDRQDVLWTFARSDMGQGQTIALYELSAVRPQDLSAFDQDFGLPPVHLQTVAPQGSPGQVGGAYQSEATMDVEWAHAMAPDARLVVYLYRKPTIQSIAAAIEAAAEHGDLSFSTSVVQPDFVNNSEAYLRRVELFNDVTVATATQEGLAVFAAAGDHGGVTPTTSNAFGHFSWPAGNDYVVAVGGTQWNNGRESYWNSGTTQGVLWAGAWGYTDNTSVPTWQTTEWEGLGLGRPTNRYIPDVSMVASNALVIVRGRVTIAGGTSLAAPLWAAVWALAQNWHIRVTGKPAPPPAPAALYTLGQDRNLALPPYLDQSPYSAASFGKYNGFGSPDVTSLIQDLVTIAP